MSRVMHKLITALVEIYYSGRLNRPLITFQQAGRKWSRARCWSRRWALRSTRPPTSASRPTITFPSVCGTTHPARTSGAASSPMRSALYNFMVVNSEFLHRCMDTQMFFFHGFYNHSLELRRISFVWYSFWHRKTPLSDYLPFASILDKYIFFFRCKTSKITTNHLTFTDIFPIFHKWKLIYKASLFPKNTMELFPWKQTT